MSKRILSAALALALSLSLAVPAFAEEESPFDDVPLDHWAIEAIRQAAEELFRFDAASLSAVGRVRGAEEYQELLN